MEEVKTCAAVALKP
jgi:hypothetical protein